MYLLFAGLTFLIAHVFFFSARDLGWFIEQLFGKGMGLFALRYIAAAVVVGIFFYFGKLPRRLPKPLSGRKFLAAGVAVYVLYLLILYGGLLGYRPGLGMLLMPALYLAPTAMVFILIGAGMALLDAEPKARSAGNEI